MTTFVALLRGINVSGQKPIRMVELAESCTALGWRDVGTYLQSGNVVFNAGGTDTRKLAAGLRKRIAGDFGHDVAVRVLSATELDRMAKSNPMRPPSGEKQKLYHATFLFETVAAERFGKLALPARPGEKAILAGQVVLLYCPHGYGTTRLNNNFFEKALGVAATTRNWRTVLALRDLCAER